MFWSGVVLTGNQTTKGWYSLLGEFWSGVVLTGNQTMETAIDNLYKFWSGVVLTGNQTPSQPCAQSAGFGAVSF